MRVECKLTNLTMVLCVALVVVINDLNCARQSKL